MRPDGEQFKEVKMGICVIGFHDCCWEKKEVDSDIVGLKGLIRKEMDGWMDGWTTEEEEAG